jgi:DNA-binding transcriptional LysR family regulator
MNTFQLECFLTVADFLNFAKASKKMNISQPSMTHQIQTLEAELHTSLFHRTTRIVELTTEGQAFLDDAKHIVSISHDAINRFSGTDTETVKTLSIGCTSYLNTDFLAECIYKLHLAYPNVHPKFQLMPGPQLLSKLESGSIDLALETKIPDAKKNQICYKELVKSSIVCIGIKEFLNEYSDSLEIKDMIYKPTILCNPASLLPDIASLHWELSKGKKMKDIYFCEDIESMLIMAQAGLGITILPKILIPERFDNLRCITVQVPSLSFGVYYQRKQQKKVLNDFIKIISEVIK